VYFVLYQGNS